MSKKDSDWLKIVMGISAVNQSALFHRSIAMLL